jgi:hypothetical protein
MKLPAFSLVPTIFSVCIIIASLFPTVAQANYVYNYTGNPFQVTYTEIVNVGEGEYITVETLVDTFLNAQIRTTELLAPGSTIDDVTSMKFFADFIYGSTMEIAYPGPPPTPSDYNPEVSGYLNIGSIDANGLPTTWNIGISEWVFVGGRGHLKGMTTSNLQDTLSGYDEPFVFYTGSLANQPGTWQLAVSPVPEPETYGLFMVGLGIVAAIARRRKSNHF